MDVMSPDKGGPTRKWDAYARDFVHAVAETRKHAAMLAGRNQIKHVMMQLLASRDIIPDLVKNMSVLADEAYRKWRNLLVELAQGAPK